MAGNWNEECPHCLKRVETIYERFVANDYGEEFDMPCPHCGQTIFVEVRAEPMFCTHKEESQ